jgi:hypothetical protein
MAAVAHSPAFAKKVGVPQSVGQDFNEADKGRKFSKGGNTMATKLDPRVMQMMAARAGRPGMAAPARSPMARPAMAAPGMKDGGMPMVMKDGKKVPTFAADGKGAMKHGGSVKKMAGGGLASGHKSADGIASKGKTKGKNIVMKKGGMC